MRLHWPWAKWKHRHVDPTLWKYATCPACGHEVLASHVSAKSVRVKTQHVEWGYIFGASCDPGFDLLEVTADGEMLTYLGGVRVVVDIPDFIESRAQEEFERLSPKTGKGP